MDFGTGRRLEANLAMRAVLGRLEEPFTGARLKLGEIAPEFEDVKPAAEYYTRQLVGFMESLGADVRVVVRPPEGSVTGADAALGEMPDGVPYMAPFETIVISGTVPGNALLQGRRATPQIIEACAEVVRVMLATAIVGAADDCEGDERVVVYLRTEPELGGQIDFQTNKMVGLCRIRGVIYCKNEPRVSYLLGTCYGMDKPHKLVWDFPLVEHIYGPNRLRWRDLRSPDYEPVEAPKLVVPS